MDAAVWMTQAVVDGRRSDRHADAVAHRHDRDARRARAGNAHRVRWRWPRRVDIPADAVADAVAEPVGPLETVDDGRELAGAGRR